MTTRKAMELTAITEGIRTIYCYSYHRISTKEQIKGGGIRRQLEASTAFCEEKGWTMDTTFKLTDIGKSAYYGKNLDDKAALGSFLKSVEQGLIKRPAVLLVESLDRISRANIMDALEIFIRILNTGITICTYIDRMIYSKEELQNNFAPLIISITLMCRSHDESAVKAKRLRASWSQKRSDGENGKLIHKGIYPSWIDVSSGKPVVIEQKAKMVQYAFDLCINGNMSYKKIINCLERKYGNNALPRRLIPRLFQTKRVLGIYEPNTTSYKDGVRKPISTCQEIHAYPAIIDEETYYLAKAAIGKRKETHKGRPQNKEVNFFKSVMRCGHCNASYVWHSGGKYNSYRCITQRDYGKNNCGQLSVLVPKHFQIVLLTAISVVDLDDILESASNTKKAKLSQELSAKQSELEDKQIRIDNLADLVETGSKTGIQRVTKLETEVASISKQMIHIQDQLDMMASPTMAASLDHINAFHQRFLLGEATIDDQIPFIESLKNTVENITIFSPEKEGQRSIAVINLLSGIKIRVVVLKDYSANVYKGKKLLARLEARTK